MWLLLRGSRSVARVLSRGFLLGAVEWILFGFAQLVLAGRVVTKSLHSSPRSVAGDAGTILGGGLASALAGGVSIAMVLLCLLGFTLTRLMRREMKTEAASPRRRCPECAESIQPEAKRCRYCGAILVESQSPPGGA